jgi:hypothetical protein
MSDVVGDAARYIRSRSSGEVIADGHIIPIQYVVDGAGRLVAPVMFVVASTIDVVLFIPEYGDITMQVQVTPAPLAPETAADGASIDRWRIYHGEPKDTHWVVLDVDAVKYQDEIIDGAGIPLANALAEDEIALCRWLNAERLDAVRTLCRTEREIEVEDPRVVGVDTWGFDVRARFSVIRFEYPAPVASAEEARLAIARRLDRPDSETRA